MNRVDSDLFQRRDEMSRWGRTCDDCSHGSCQFLHARVVDKPNLSENDERQNRDSESWSGTGFTCTVGAPQ